MRVLRSSSSAHPLEVVLLLKSDICRRVAKLTDATVQFGLVPTDHWIQPSWINETKASASREKMAKDGVIYGGALSTLDLVHVS
jgi:Glycolipid 2-alpha-mannosyltransferase